MYRFLSCSLGISTAPGEYQVGSPTSTGRILSKWFRGLYRRHGHLWKNIFFGNVGYGPRENGPFQCPSQAKQMVFWDDIGGILWPYL